MNAALVAGLFCLLAGQVPVPAGIEPRLLAIEGEAARLKHGLSKLETEIEQLRRESLREGESVVVTVPDLGWSLVLDEVWLAGGVLISVSTLSRPPGPAGQMLTTLSVPLPVPPEGRPVVHCVLGRSWAWTAGQGVIFLEARSDLDGLLRNARQIHPAPVEKR